MKEVGRCLRSEKVHLPRNLLHYNIQQLLRENQLVFFIYSYLLYCNLKLLRSRRINVFLESLIEIL
jgi:hypothetical protein